MGPLRELLQAKSLHASPDAFRCPSGLIRRLACIFASTSLTIFLGACGSPGGSNTVTNANESAKKSQAPQGTKAIQSDWIESVNSSGIDGKTVTRTKEFKTGQDESRVIVKLTCLVDSKKLTVSIESYGSDGSTPSSFVTQHTIIAGLSAPAGRLKLASSDPVELGGSFKNDKYTNVIAWNLSFVAREFIATQWSDRYYAAKSAFEKIHPPGSGYQNYIAMESWIKDKNGLQLSQREQAEKAYAAGNYLRSALPIVIEASNQQGTFEIQIPASDSGVNDLIANCSKSGLTAAQLDSIFDFATTRSSSEPMLSGDSTPVAVTPTATSPVQADATSERQSESSVPLSAPGSQAPTATANQPSASPSFDCSKSATKVETLICTTPELSAADNEMSAAYRRIYAAAGPNAGAVKQGQRDFIAKRNQCETSVCIVEAYRSRLAMLAQSGT